MSHAALSVPGQAMHAGVLAAGTNGCPALPFAVSGQAALPCVMAAAFLDRAGEHGTVVLHNKCAQEVKVTLPGRTPLSAMAYDGKDKGGWANLTAAAAVPWTGPLTVLYPPIDAGAVLVPAVGLAFVKV
jgi:hypothetical protein